MRLGLVIIGISLLVGVAVVLSLSRSRQPKQVELESAARHTISPLILASGTLSYESEVHLVAEVVGRVLTVTVKEGDFVRQGDLLIQLDPAAARAAVEQLEAALRQSELNTEHQRVTLATQSAKWKRYEALMSSGVVDRNTYEEIVSERDLDQVELDSSLAMLRQTNAQLKQAREQLAKTAIRAPISGEVTAVSIREGETAVPSAVSIPGSNLVELAQTRSMFAEVNVDEADVTRVEVGQSATIVPAAAEERSWKGTVEQIAVAPQAAAGEGKTYDVRIRLQERPPHFRPGMSCRAEIATRASTAPEVLAVSLQAVLYEDTDDFTRKSDQASVFVLQDGTARKRTVEIGAADDTYLEILKGLRAGEQVVTGPAKVLRFLRDGDRIAIQDPAAPDTIANR
jgi:HlyD family secretion protein